MVYMIGWRFGIRLLGKNSDSVYLEPKYDSVDPLSLEPKYDTVDPLSLEPKYDSVDLSWALQTNNYTDHASTDVPTSKL